MTYELMNPLVYRAQSDDDNVGHGKVPATADSRRSPRTKTANPTETAAKSERPPESGNGSNATQVPNREAKVDRERALKNAARAWNELKVTADQARGAEQNAQAQEDQARWQQARLAADLYGRWGRDGLTFKAIADQFVEPVSNIKLFVGTQNEFAGRNDLSERRFSDWQKIHTAIRSEMKRIERMVHDEVALEKLTGAVEEKLSGLIDDVVADENLKTTRDFGKKIKGSLRKLAYAEHARLFPPPRPTGDSLRLGDGVDDLGSPDAGSTSLVILDAPYGTHANPRGLQMANNTAEEARDLLIKIAPMISRLLTDNGFVFWFRPGFVIEGTDSLKPILNEYFHMRQLVWFKTRAGLSAEGKNIGLCHELIYMLWPKDRSQPVPHLFLPDCFYVSHDGMSGPNSPHPSAKPVALFERLIEATTMPGDLVVDPFAGSGASVAAALKLGRRIVAAEIVPEVFELAQQRLTECRVDLANDPVTAAFAAERGIVGV